MKTKLLIFVVAALSLAGLAGAQSTPYSTPNFSATFNSPVTTSTDRNSDGTRSNYYYGAKNKGVEQLVCVRIIDHDIDLNKSSTNFYADQAAKGMTLEDRKDGTYQGHLYVLVRVHDATAQRKLWVILVNARTVIMFLQQAPVGADDSSDWSTLANSLIIK